jgi:hypothetical protein
MNFSLNAIVILTLSPAITATTFSAETLSQMGRGVFITFSTFMLTGRFFFSSLSIALEIGLSYWIEISP